MSGAVVAFLAGSAATAAYGIYSKTCEKDTTEDTTSTERGIQADGTNKSRSMSVRSAAGASAKQQEGFLSDILAQFWSYINAAASQTIKESVEPEFKTLPGPLSSLHFIKVDLGNVPIRLDNIVVHEIDKGTNTLQMDLDVHWDGNCNIQLKANYLGSFGVKSIKLFGRMSILMKPVVETLSLVQAVQVSFINPPKIDIDFVGLANIADMKMLKRRINTIIQDIVKGMMVLPQRQLTKLDMACSFMKIYQPPLGICRITVLDGKGFEEEKRTLRKSDVPDCYVDITIGDKTCRSKTVKDSLTPIWNETMDFVLCDHDQIVQMQVYDEDDGTMDADDDLGGSEATVGDILLHGGKLELKVQDEENRLTGSSVSLGCALLQLTPDLKSLKTEATSPSEICGMITILVTQAFELPMKKEEVAANVKITCGKQTFTTATVTDYPGKDSLNPFFDAAFHVPLTADLVEGGKVMDVCFSLMNKEDCLGTIVINHAVLAASPDKVVTEKKAIGSKGALLEYRVILRGVQSSQGPAVSKPTAPDVAATETIASKVAIVGAEPAISEEKPTIRVTAVKGSGFQVEKSRRPLKRKDVPDVYCIIKYGSSPTAWRTKTIDNSLTPEWYESNRYPFLNHSQILHIEVFDEDSGRRDTDDYMGTARVTVGKILLAGGSQDIEIENEGKPTGMFITIACELIGA